MGKFREGKGRDQLTFLPRSLDEYVSSEDPVRFVDALIEELDLKPIELAYSRLGAPAFSPRVLSKIILYGKMRGVRSCRELSRAARENVKFMYLAKDEKPDFRTINLFRKKFHRELSELLGQTVQIALQEGMLTLEHVAIDSTQLKGYASKRSYHDPEELERLVKEIESSFEKDIAEDKDEDDDEPTLPPDLQDKQRLREKAREALKTYQSMKKEGTKCKQPKKISTTDPECRYLAGGPAPIRGYRMQAAVDSKSRLVVAGYATNTSDNAQLCPMLDELERNTGQQPHEISTDRGYSGYAGLQALKEKGIIGFIPLRQKIKPHRKRKGDPCEPGVIEEMVRRTASDLGQEKKTLRSATVEPLFAHLKHARALTRTFFRGLAMVNLCWSLELVAVNLEKIIRFRMQPLATGQST